METAENAVATLTELKVDKALVDRVLAVVETTRDHLPKIPDECGCLLCQNPTIVY